MNTTNKIIKPFLSFFYLLVFIFLSCEERLNQITTKNPVKMEYLTGRWKTPSHIYTILASKKLTKKSLRTGEEEFGKWELDSNILFFKYEGKNSENESYEITSTLKDEFFAIGRTKVVRSEIEMPTSFARLKSGNGSLGH